MPLSMEKLVTDSPVYLLGKKIEYIKSKGEKEGWSDVLQDFRSRIWITYRKNFSALPGTEFTSDTGWGCLLRTMQMMFAEAFIRLLLGRSWSLKENENKETMATYRKILQWFLDGPLGDCPFSLHRITSCGTLMYDMKCGEWCGPALGAQVLQVLAESYLGKDIAVYCPIDQNVCREKVLDLCCPGWKSDKEDEISILGSYIFKKPLFVVIPLRLGEDELNPVYKPLLRTLMHLPQSLGIVGGRPSASLYFVGCQGDNLLYLDPHHTQESVIPSTEYKIPEDFPTNSYHCGEIKVIAMDALDPSMAFGFYCPTWESFCVLCGELEKSKVVSLYDRQKDMDFCVGDSEDILGSDDDDDMVLL
eukprot:Rmarinus@m.4312